MEYFSFPFKEFGFSLSVGLLIPYIYRNAGNKVSVYSIYPFPEEWTNKWYDEYHCADKKTWKKKFGRESNGNMIFKRFILRKVLKTTDELHIPEEAIESIPLPQLPIPLNRPYVVLIPSIYEYIMKVGKWKTNPNRWRHSLAFSEWLRIASYCRSRGYRVVCIYDDQSCGYQAARQIGDIILGVKRNDVKQHNQFFVDQLKWMQHAKINIAFGGAIHICWTFRGIAGLGVDKIASCRFRTIIKVLLKKRRDLHITPDLLKYDISNNRMRPLRMKERRARTTLNYDGVIEKHKDLRKYIIDKLSVLL